MILKIKKDLHLNDYSVELCFEEITAVDREKLNDFGVVKVEVGGKIPLTEDTEFVISNDIKAIPEEFPIKRVFATSVYGENARPYAEAYIAEMKKRVKTQIDIINSKVDDFSEVEKFQL